ncbi:MAG: ATP-binding protein [Chloroflexota bacterium]
MHSLSLRFLFAFIAIILVTTLSAGLPAYICVRAELDRQAWTRVSDGGRVTRALLETEEVRLENLATLITQRPTLQDLARLGDTAGLDDYLHTFQATVDLDILFLSDASGQVLARGAELSDPARPSFSQGPVYQVLGGDPSQLALLVSKPISPDQGPYVTVGVFLDDNYASSLAMKSGFEHSFLTGEGVSTPPQVVSTTLSDRSLPETVVAAVRRANASGQPQTARLDFRDAHYYVTLLPLSGERGEVVGLSAVILPVASLLAANRTAFLVLTFSTLCVALAAIGLAVYLARRLATPLEDLTRAAIKIGQGDLASPVPIPESPSEIAALAAAFEKSRAATLLAHEGLSRANAWFETLIQSVVEGIVIIDDRGIVTLFNQSAEQITGWKADQVLGMSVYQVFPLSESDSDFMERIPLSGAAQQVIVRTCQGEEISLAVTRAPLQSPQGEATQVALVIRDVSKEEAARRLRSYFLANISHEFRTPLAALNASVELLLEDLEKLSLAEIAELLNSIHLSGAGLQTLINNLLESASIEAGRFRIRCRPTDLGEVVVEALQVMNPLLERRRQHLTLSIPAEIPFIHADPTRLSQVLVNLISNASKYSPPESAIELRLEIEDPRTLRVSVCDQGDGVPPSDRPKLYRPFTRLREAEAGQHSIGLGLSVVRAIVEAHQGEVGVDERPGGGSIFWFTIPMQEAL